MRYSSICEFFLKVLFQIYIIKCFIYPSLANRPKRDTEKSKKIRRSCFDRLRLKVHFYVDFYRIFFFLSSHRVTCTHFYVRVVSGYLGIFFPFQDIPRDRIYYFNRRSTRFSNFYRYLIFILNNLEVISLYCILKKCKVLFFLELSS